ncbi:hypothetical protein AGMMS49938_01020 [Fibrobacterales bacterium]|nr:hypothetical protein AGMMS49938_01020 [Fibrobacterales bacterium]
MPHAVNYFSKFSSMPQIKNTASHLTFTSKVNQGSFYTPPKYVNLVMSWLVKHCVGEKVTIMDPSCGYGAFFALSKEFQKNRFIGNDIDKIAVQTAASNFPFIERYNLNILQNVSRKAYSISPDETLCIVGNPPYNDTTSQIRNELKTDKISMDSDIQTRDLGISSLLAYNKLEADFVAVLHPLSYLIKGANFSAGANFFKNYTMIEHIIFNSQEFENTSKMTGFPIIVALYKRTPFFGMEYQDVLRTDFKTVEGDSFKPINRDYLSDFVEKYPNKNRYSQEILFYTLRDINALKRSRTFIKERVSNAVDVNPAKLAYYCYIDTFKQFADVPYYLGNMDIPFIHSTFYEIKDDVMAISKYNHKDIFSDSKLPSENSMQKVRNYINRVVSYKG